MEYITILFVVLRKNVEKMDAMMNININRIKNDNNCHHIIQKYLQQIQTNESARSIDPFANNDYKLAKINNGSTANAEYNIEAMNFLKIFDNNSIDILIYGAPYNTTFLKKYYEKSGFDLQRGWQNTYYSSLKREVFRIVKNDGYVISIGYNSNGIGKSYGFSITDLTIMYGAPHDLYIMKEKKVAI